MELLSISQVSTYLENLTDWDLEDNGKLIIKNFKFKDFKEAVDFVNKVSGIADTLGHHPDIRLYDYNNLEIKLTTHSSGGLTEKDFNMASEIDKL